MLRYIAKRLLASIPVLFGVLVAVFFLLRVLPGDPTQVMAAEFGASAEDLARMRAALGIDDPLLVQFKTFVVNVAQGDLGRSLFTQRPVTTQILGQLPSTIQLAVASLAIAILIGVPIGVIAAVRANSWVDAGSMVVALIGVSMPSFWLGLILIYIFSFRLGWLPSAGVGGLRELIMPAFALGFSSSAIIARLTRSSMLEILRQEYVTTARAKGLTPRVVIVRHALRNAIIPLVTITGLQFAGLLGGAVIIETVFARKGLGSLTVQAILQKDYPLVQGTILVVALVYILVNLIVDVSYAFLDPRIRYE
jgi:peptide/nickel transport system permease protein/oligopeptide transport system permease protein